MAGRKAGRQAQGGLVRVGFYCQTPGPHLDMAKYLIRSVRKSMPGVEIVHLTNGECPKHPEADDVRRVSGLPMAVTRITHHAELAGDWLFIDTDCLVIKDVRSVFRRDFEIGLTDRKGSIWEKTPYGMVMPYNMGVTFSRGQEFWEKVLHYLKTLPAKFQEWEGDQRVVCEMVAAGYPARILPGKVYNFTPESRGDSTEHASILHLKGPRKLWIGDYEHHCG